MNDLSFHWKPYDVMAPCIRELIYFQEPSLIFKGHCLLDPCVFPVQRVLSVYDPSGDTCNIYHIEILEKVRQSLPPSIVEEEEEEDNTMGILPLELIVYKYRVIKEMESKDEEESVLKRIYELEYDIRAKNSDALYRRLNGMYEEF